MDYIWFQVFVGLKLNKYFPIIPSIVFVLLYPIKYIFIIMLPPFQLVCLVFDLTRSLTKERRIFKRYVKCTKMPFNLVVLNVLCEKLDLESCQKKKRFFLKGTKREVRQTN